MYGKIAQEDVTRAVDIPVEFRPAPRTAKHLGSTQATMNMTARSTRLARVLLRANNHSTPRILSRLVDQMLAETEVGPREHCACSLGMDASLSAPNHVLCAKLRQ